MKNINTFIKSSTFISIYCDWGGHATRLHDAKIWLFEEIDYGFFVLEAISKYKC